MDKHRSVVIFGAKMLDFGIYGWYLVLSTHKSLHHCVIPCYFGQLLISTKKFENKSTIPDDATTFMTCSQPGENISKPKAACCARRDKIAGLFPFNTHLSITNFPLSLGFQG